MATARRVFWETVIFLSLLLLFAGEIFWSGRRLERRTAALNEQLEQRLGEAERRQREEIEELRQSWEILSRQHAREQAKAALGAFEAGIRSATAARWGRYLDSAASNLASRPGILFVHLMRPDGRILTSSGTGIGAGDQLDEPTEWALGVEELTSRDGEDDGILELAVPVTDNNRTIAVLWMGYDLEAALAASDARP